MTATALVPVMPSADLHMQALISGERWLRLREKSGKLNELPCHQKLEEYRDAYITAAGVAEDREGPLFRTAIGKTKKTRCGRNVASECPKSWARR